MMRAITVSGLKQSAPEQGASVARNVIWLGVMWLVHRHLVPFSTAAPLAYVVTQAWSSVEKAAIRDVLSCTTGKTDLQTLVLTRKVSSVSSFLHLDSLGSKLSAFVDGLAPEVKAALPLDFGQNLDSLASDFAAEGKALIADEVTAAQAKWPPEAVALAQAAEGVADQKIDQAKAALQAEIDKWTAVKAAAATATSTGS